MKKLPQHKIEIAKQKLREELSFENLKKLPQYRNLTKEDYNLLVTSIEAICLVLLESYIRGTNI